MADGFLGRWSRRKIDVLEGKPLDEPLPGSLSGQSDELAARPVHATVPAVARASEPGPEAAPAPDVALPTLEDVGRLTPQSDFSPFVARGVAPEVSNAAMKKLFADPHYNIMDGLDIYIDDYSLPDPLPESMMRQMVSAQFLNLFDEKKDEPKDGSGEVVRDDADTLNPQSVAQSQQASQVPIDNNPDSPEASQTPVSGPAPQVSPTPDTADHANTDLRLQQNHAAGAEDPRRSAQ
jgi:hypothetical protein